MIRHCIIDRYDRCECGAILQHEWGKSLYKKDYLTHHPFMDVRRHSGAAANFVGIFVGSCALYHQNNLYISMIYAIKSMPLLGTKFLFPNVHGRSEKPQKARFSGLFCFLASAAVRLQPQFLLVYLLVH